MLRDKWRVSVFSLPKMSVPHVSPAHRFTAQHLSLLPQNVQNLDVGRQLELFTS